MGRRLHRQPSCNVLNKKQHGHNCVIHLLKVHELTVIMAIYALKGKSGAEMALQWSRNCSIVEPVADPELRREGVHSKSTLSLGAECIGGRVQEGVSYKKINFKLTSQREIFTWNLSIFRSSSKKEYVASLIGLQFLVKNQESACFELLVSK